MALTTGARHLAGYDCALLVECVTATDGSLSRKDGCSWRVTAVSGTASVDPEAPLVRAVTEFIATVADSAPSDTKAVQGLDLARQAPNSELAERTRAFPHLLWVPLQTGDGRFIGGLAAFRSTLWPADRRVGLAALGEPFAHAYAALAGNGIGLRPGLRRMVASGRLMLMVPMVALAVLLFPVRFSVLAPAEVVGSQPTLISAPLDGIVAMIAVSPGDPVKKGDKLFGFVDTKLRNDVEIAQKNRAVAVARFQRVIQSAVANHRDSHEIAVARADLDVADAELALANDLLQRVEVRAPRDGVAVFGAKTDWIGRPITTGERVMDIVDPSDVELRIDLGVADSLTLEPGMGVRLFLDGQPLGARSASLTRIGYRPTPGPDQQMVYRIFADFPEASPAPRLGARGTARLDGSLVPLGFYLFRRPIAALRQKLGI
ncbi:MAG TPA: HlyD family efflux transporter periplasmic adaptor subunit [Beijerinckiaceae bacterium]|nr:HlyD family efflux transporter periplasmic adaptor subunit [Beijerinckiaceae bacterium]